MGGEAREGVRVNIQVRSRSCKCRYRYARTNRHAHAGRERMREHVITSNSVTCVKGRFAKVHAKRFVMHTP